MHNCYFVSLVIVNLIFHLLPSEDQSSSSPSEVRRELAPQRVQPEGQRADTAPGPKWEQWLNQAHPHHCRNNDVSALCERNRIDVLCVIIFANVNYVRFTLSRIFTLVIRWFDFYKENYISLL